MKQNFKKASTLRMALINMKEKYPAIAEKFRVEWDNGIPDIYSFYGITNIEFTYRKSKVVVTVSHAGQMGNQLEHAEKNFDQIFGENKFNKMYAEKVFEYGHPSYMWWIHVPVEKFLEAVK